MSIFETLNITDDLDISINPETYQDQSNPAPVAPGVYLLKPVDYEIKRKKDGTPVTFRSKATGKDYPVITIKQVEVVEPVEMAGRKVYVYQDFSFLPRKKNGQQPQSDAGNLLRAMDANRAAVGLSEMVDATCELLDQGTPFFGRIDWQAYDKDFVDAEFAKIEGGREAATWEQKNPIYDVATTRGYKNFPQIEGTSRYSHTVRGKTGTLLTARANIVFTYASNARVPMVGPVAEFQD